MKTNKQKATQRVATIGIIALAAIIAIAFIACKNDDGGNDIEQPKVQPDTPRTLSFGTDCKVTIKSDDTFLTAEWSTLCNSVVAAIGRGYGAANPVAKNGIESHFTSNTVSAVLLKSATYDVEVKSTVPNTIYFKANDSVIDGISGADFLSIINSIVSGSSFHLPNDTP